MQVIQPQCSCIQHMPTQWTQHPLSNQRHQEGSDLNREQNEQCPLHRWREQQTRRCQNLTDRVIQIHPITGLLCYPIGEGHVAHGGDRDLVVLGREIRKSHGRHDIRMTSPRSRDTIHRQPHGHNGTSCEENGMRPELRPNHGCLFRSNDGQVEDEGRPAQHEMEGDVHPRTLVKGHCASLEEGYKLMNEVGQCDDPEGLVKMSKLAVLVGDERLHDDAHFFSAPPLPFLGPKRGGRFSYGSHSCPPFLNPSTGCDLEMPMAMMTNPAVSSSA